MRLVGFVTALAMVLAGCGGGAGDTTVAAPATTNAPTTIAPTTTVAPTTTAVASADSEWCRLSLEINMSDALDNLGFVGPEQTEAEMAEFVGLLEEAAAVAPPELDESVQTSLAAFRSLFETLRDFDYNVIALFDDPEALATINDESAQAAGDAISAYNEAQCGIADEPSGDDAAIDDLIDAGGITSVFVEQLVTNGFTQEEADCIAENLDLSELLTGPDEAAITAVTLECVSLERLEELGSGG
ncbi:MAG: hypothetical protein HKN07_02305 [Acidimicrobiia bacterium]|nr:hypothetical protein [Acidimicrobiia bacterium]